MFPLMEQPISHLSSMFLVGLTTKLGCPSHDKCSSFVKWEISSLITVMIEATHKVMA